MSNLQNRRTFLASAGITVASIVSQPLNARFDKPKSPPIQGIRESVAGMDADHPVLVTYRKAIDAMRKMPATDPLSWQFQANMHGALKEDGANEGWRWCMHGNWWFLPWHRGYLYFFEKIVRKISSDDDFRLPYWPWEKGSQNVLPAPFRDAKYQGLDNALFDAKRVNAANNGLPLRPASGSFSADWESVLTTGRFTTAVSELSFGGLQAMKTNLPERPSSSNDHGVMESRAHDLLHDAVGGNTGNMGDPDTAARDPIFWLHHANVDRLWNRWLDIKTHHIPDVVADKDWYDQEFPFYDDNGKQVVVTVREILEMASKESRYDEERRLFATATPHAMEKTMESKIISVGAIQPMLKLDTKPFFKPLELSKDTKPKLMAALANPLSDVEPAAVLLRVEGITPPKDAGLTFEVFLAKKGEKASKKSYVGPISFFGRRGEHAHDKKKEFTQGFDVTSLVQKLRSANKGKLPELEVSVIPHSTTGLSDEDLAKKTIDIPISNITLKLVTAEQKK